MKKGKMRGGIRRTGARSWEIKVELPRSADGQRSIRYHSFKGTRNEAVKERARLIADIEKSVYSDPKRVTVREQLEAWLQGHVAVHIENAATRDDYAHVVNRHLIPGLGEIQLRHLTQDLIEAYYAKRLAAGLGRRTVAYHHTVLKMGIAHAVPRLLPRNPVNDAKRPSFEEPEIQVLDDAQIAMLLKSVKYTRPYAIIVLGVTCGLRRGEVLGLRWECVNLTDATLKIEKSLRQRIGGEVELKGPKTKRSRRTIALPQISVAALREHRKAQAEERMALGLGKPEFVFTTLAGKPIQPRTFSTEYRRLARKAGVPGNFHSLRHSHATALLKAGTPIRVVSDRLGHASPTITLSIYAHTMAGDDAAAAAQVDAALRKALET